MSAPRTRQDPPVDASDRGPATAVLEAHDAELAQHLHEAELDLAIESAASRLLGFALAREGEEQYPETE
ncbi:MAG TPA: hypothetical protein VF363_10420 [Candidatus Eisenbacteria bacterium]